MFDTISGVWSKLNTPTSPLVLALHHRQVAYLDGFGCMLADPTRATDDDGTGAPTWVLSTIAFEPLNFTGIDRFGRVWKLQIQGEAKGACHLTLSVVYDDGVSTGAPLTESWDFDVDPSESLKYEFLPQVEPIQNLSLFLSTSFEGDVSGESITLEALGFLIGMYPVLPPVKAATKRVQSNG